MKKNVVLTNGLNQNEVKMEEELNERNKSKNYEETLLKTYFNRNPLFQVIPQINTKIHPSLVFYFYMNWRMRMGI